MNRWQLVEDQGRQGELDDILASFERAANCGSARQTRTAALFRTFVPRECCGGLDSFSTELQPPVPRMGSFGGKAVTLPHERRG